ncbi:MAG: TRAP transporter large permease subunit [Thermoleophilia bacterium]|nr:TRAP transporter large permease subunit [Thermoleophilia bacterium]
MTALPNNSTTAPQPGRGSRFVTVLERADHIFDLVVGPINRATRYIRYLVLVLMILVVAADVFSRYVLDRSLIGAIEIQAFALVIVIFLSLPELERDRSHIRVDILVNKFSPCVRNVLDNAFYLVIAILFTIVSKHIVLQAIKKSTEVSSALKLPISAFVGIAAAGLILLTATLYMNYLRTVIELVRGRRSPFLLIGVILGVAFVLLPHYVTALPLTGLALGGTIFLVLFILLFLGMPLGYAMTLAGYVGLLVTSNNSAAVGNLVGIAPYTSVADYMFAVLPMFLLMGSLAYFTGLSEGLFSAGNRWLGRYPGGLAMASVAGCAGFGAICGDSMATAVTMTKVALPEMRKRDYDPSIATGSLAAGGTLGILIPPSIGFIIYALIAEESVGKLFVAGIIPGVVLALLFMFTIYIIARLRPALVPTGEKYSLKERLISLKGVIGVVLLFVLILGGMLGGIFSANEAGAIGCLGAIIIALPFKKLNWSNFIKAVDDTVSVSARLFLIIIGVGIFGYFLAATKVPILLADTVAGLDVNRYAIFAAVCVLYVILGCVMNVIPMMMLTLPSLLPTVMALGFDPIWFGVVLVILMEMGQITPPIGMCVFTISSAAPDVPMYTIFKGVFPFVLVMIIMIILLTVFPQIALVIPNWLM